MNRLHQFNYGSATITWRLEHAQRKTLGITVTPEGAVVARAPEGTLFPEIEARMLRRAPWILKQQRYFESFRPRSTDKRYLSGESHLYLGRQYRLQITAGLSDGVRFTGRELWLTKRPRTDAQNLLETWYRERARQVIDQLAQPWLTRFARYHAVPEGIYLKAMATRWGSCTAKGKIFLNPILIKAPKACIEYVIVHELCHLVHPHHGKALFALLSRELPDWDKRKEKLERLLA